MNYQLNDVVNADYRYFKFLSELGKNLKARHISDLDVSEFGFELIFEDNLLAYKYRITDTNKHMMWRLKYGI